VDGEVDPRPGGIFRVAIRLGSTVRGEYVEVDPPRRVVFTWGWEDEGSLIPPGSSTVEIDLDEDGDGTLLRLTHRDIPDAMNQFAGMGWTHYLPRFAAAAAGGDAGPDPWANFRS
jgi:uncharacterized protein YndB with AHSA1/START domain